MSSSSAALPLCMLGMMRLRTKAKIGGATRFRELVTLHPHHPLPGRGRARRMFWVQAKKGFAELLSQKRGFGGKKRSYELLKPGVVSPRLQVPKNIPRPPYAKTEENPPGDKNVQVHGAQGIERMREASRLAAQVLQYAGTLIKPGVTTDSIDKAVHKMIIDAGAYPSPLGYGGFPKSVW